MTGEGHRSFKSIETILFLKLGGRQSWLWFYLALLYIFFKAWVSTIQTYLKIHVDWEIYKLKQNATPGIRIVYNHRLSTFGSPTLCLALGCMYKTVSFLTILKTRWMGKFPSKMPSERHCPRCSVTGPKKVGSRKHVRVSSYLKVKEEKEHPLPSHSTSLCWRQHCRAQWRPG